MTGKQRAYLRGLANTIDAKVVVPTHYGCIVGTSEDAEKFAKLVREKEVRILIK